MYTYHSLKSHFHQNNSLSLSLLTTSMSNRFVRKSDRRQLSFICNQQIVVQFREVPQPMNRRDSLSAISLLFSGVKATDDRGSRPVASFSVRFSVAATIIAFDKCVSTNRAVIPLCPAFAQAVAGQNGTGNRAGIENAKSSQRQTIGSSFSSYSYFLSNIEPASRRRESSHGFERSRIATVASR